MLTVLTALAAGADAGASKKEGAPKAALTESQKIEALIGFVRDSHLTFIRNGTEYSAEKGAEHLRQKLDYAGKRIKTARQFIDTLATESSATHQPYLVKRADGTTIPLRDWLNAQLARLEEDHQASPKK